MLGIRSTQKRSINGAMVRKMESTHKTEIARKVFLAVLSLTILFFIISPSLGAAEGKYSIRGYVFNDVNGNGEWNKDEDKGLENWIVYIDENGNNNRDAGEEYRNTNETGYYNISDLENGTYQVREVLQPNWTPISVPVSYEVEIGGADPGEYNFGNIESRMILINPDQVSKLFWIYLVGAMTCGFFGLVLFLLGALNCGCYPIKADRGSIAMAIAGLLLILFAVYLLGNLKDMSGIGSHLGIDQLPMWALILIAVLLFAALLGVGICRPEQMESDQMRRAIAGLLVFGFVAILIFSLYDKLPAENREIVSQYIQLVGIIIGFYFGAKVTSDAAGMKSEIGHSKSIVSKIEIVDLDTASKPYKVSVKNSSQDPVMLKRIDLEDVDRFKTIFSFNPENAFVGGMKPASIQLTGLDKLDPNTNNLIIRIWTSDNAVTEKGVKLSNA